MNLVRLHSDLTEGRHIQKQNVQHVKNDRGRKAEDIGIAKMMQKADY